MAEMLCSLFVRKYFLVERIVDNRYNCLLYELGEWFMFNLEEELKKLPAKPGTTTAVSRNISGPQFRSLFTAPL